jgi:hypothetical protein
MQQAMGQQPGQNAQGQQQTGQQVQQAQNNQQNAQQQLNQGQNQGAQSSMQQAAQAMQQAAQQMAKQPGKPTPNSFGKEGIQANGQVDKSPIDKLKDKYAGKAWGEIPIDERNKALTDVEQSASKLYGEDYGRIVRRYYEQLADTK